jgi:hypothetical protein
MKVKTRERQKKKGKRRGLVIASSDGTPQLAPQWGERRLLQRQLPLLESNNEVVTLVIYPSPVHPHIDTNNS